MIDYQFNIVARRWDFVCVNVNDGTRSKFHLSLDLTQRDTIDQIVNWVNKCYEAPAQPA